MFSGRMNDLTQDDEQQVRRALRLRGRRRRCDGGDVLYNALSIDGWSIPVNTKLDPDLLFQMIAASVSEDASKASIPAAFPAREGIGHPEQLAVRRRRRTTRSPSAPPAEPSP